MVEALGELGVRAAFDNFIVTPPGIEQQYYTVEHAHGISFVVAIIGR